MKKFVSGVLVGAVLAFGVSSYADDLKVLVGKSIDNEYPVVLNGTPLNNKAPAIEGTSYAPVREISEKLGLTVKFENETVILSSPAEVQKVPEVEGLPTEASVSDKVQALTEQAVELDRNILGLQRSVDGTQSIIDTRPPGQNVEALILRKEQMKQQIADLEQQKADLEKQKEELINQAPQ